MKNLGRLIGLILTSLLFVSCAINDAIDRAATRNIDYTSLPKQRLCYIVIEKSPLYFEYTAAASELKRRGENCEDY